MKNVVLLQVLHFRFFETVAPSNAKNGCTNKGNSAYNSNGGSNDEEALGSGIGRCWSHTEIRAGVGLAAAILIALIETSSGYLNG